jgi:hypothetical protein
VRAIVVVLAFLYALAFGIPTALYLGGYYGSIGVVKTGTAGPVADRDVNTVTEVLPGSPAARAGIVPGDVVVRAEAEHAPPFEQLLVRVPAGQPIPYAVVHDGRSRIVDLTPQPIRVAPVRSAVIIAMLVRGAAIALIGALLVLLRPSIMTAAFSILCLEFAELSHPAGNVELVAALPLFWKPLFLAVTCIVNGGGPAVAAIFSMRFPSGTPLPSWRPVEKAMVVVGVLTIVLYFAALYFGGTASVLGSLLYELVTIIFWLSYTVAVAAFMVRYAHSSGEDRARLRWVAIGLGSFVVSYALFWYAENSASAPRDLSWWAQFLNILPFTVAYAVVHHRVIDVRIAGGRAIAFAVMSAVPVIGFSLIDLGLSNGLQSTKFALVAEIAVAVGFGFWVNASHRVRLLPRASCRRAAAGKRRAPARARERPQRGRRDARSRAVRGAAPHRGGALPSCGRAVRARDAPRLARRRAAGDRRERQPRAGTRCDRRAGRRQSDRVGTRTGDRRTAAGGGFSDLRTARDDGLSAARRKNRR